MQQLKQAIHEAGYTVREIWEEVAVRHMISYQVFSSYCRCIHSRKKNPEVWTEIKRVLAEKGIIWQEKE